MSTTVVSPEIPFGALTGAASGVPSAASEVPDDGIQMAIDVCRLAREWNRRTEKNFRSWMAVGTTGEILRNTMGSYPERTESFLRGFQEIQARLGSAYDHSRAPGLREVFIAEFNAFLAEALAFDALVRKMLDLASTPPCIPDPERLQANEEARARGEMKLLTPGFMTRPS
jgi:hypothetical protein